MTKSIKFTTEELMTIQMLLRTKASEIINTNQQETFKETLNEIQKLYDRITNNIGE